MSFRHKVGSLVDLWLALESEFDGILVVISDGVMVQGFVASIGFDFTPISNIDDVGTVIPGAECSVTEMYIINAPSPQQSSKLSPTERKNKMNNGMASV